MIGLSLRMRKRSGRTKVKSSKTFWFDLETTGLDEKKCAIWQLAGIVEIDGNVEEEFELRFAPHEGASFEEGAMKVGGWTREELMERPHRNEGYRELKERWEFYVNKFKREDKFVPGGYNVSFDLNFLYEFFKRHKDNYLNSYIYTCPIDVRTLVGMWVRKSGMQFQNFKLETVCGRFGIPIDAHDAMSDIRATRQLFVALEGMVK